MKNTPLDIYAFKRQELLNAIIKSFSEDPRFMAAWLTGSLGRGEADEVSDLDLTVVVAGAESEKLCRCERQVSHTTTPERLELFSRFGQPAVIHENNHNAPEGGIFTFVLYSGSALMVDWVLVPQVTAVRPEPSRLLFDKVGIPLRPQAGPESMEEQMEKASEMIAFFWMMTAITIKYAIRNDGVFVQKWLENLTGLVKQIERLIEGITLGYHRGSWTQLLPSQAEQVKAIRELCEVMQVIMLRIAGRGGRVIVSPMPEIEVLLTLVERTSQP